MSSCNVLLRRVACLFFPVKWPAAVQPPFGGHGLQAFGEMGYRIRAPRKPRPAQNTPTHGRAIGAWIPACSNRTVFGLPADRALAALEPGTEGRANRPGRGRPLRRAPRRMKQQRICKQHHRDRNPAPGRQTRIRGYQRRHAINQARKGAMDVVGDKLLRLPPQGFALPRYLPRNDAKPISRLDERVFCHCTAAIVCMPNRWRRYQGTGLP